MEAAARKQTDPLVSASTWTGVERRAYPRHAVDCDATIVPIKGVVPIRGRLADLSLGGCRVVVRDRFLLATLTRVEVEFRLRGMTFRLVGVSVGSRGAKSFVVRFLDMQGRRREELAELLAEIGSLRSQDASAQGAVGDEDLRSLGLAGERSEIAGTAANPAENAEKASTDRRFHGRHPVNTSASLLLVKRGICIPGRILNLSQGGCRLRMDERVEDRFGRFSDLGVFARVEVEFYLRGLPFRLAGVSQAVFDENSIGIRFLEMSERKCEQLTELIAEIEGSGVRMAP